MSCFAKKNYVVLYCTLQGSHFHILPQLLTNKISRNCLYHSIPYMQSIRLHNTVHRCYDQPMFNAALWHEGTTVTMNIIIYTTYITGLFKSLLSLRHHCHCLCQQQPVIPSHRQQSVLWNCWFAISRCQPDLVLHRERGALTEHWVDITIRSSPITHVACSEDQKHDTLYLQIPSFSHNCHTVAVWSWISNIFTAARCNQLGKQQ